LIHHLARITPPELRLRVLTPLPLAMREGALPDDRLALPLPPAGEVRPLARRELERIFDYRTRVIQSLFGAGERGA
jgi:hypothetical protein